MKRPEGFDRITGSGEAETEQRRTGQRGTARARGDRRQRSRSAAPGSDQEARGRTDGDRGGVGPGDGRSEETAPTAATKLLDGIKDAVWPARETTRSPQPRPRSQPVAPQDREAARALRKAGRARRRDEKREVRRFTRRTRRRTVTWLVLAGTALTMGGLLAIAVFSPLLALRTIQVEGTSRIPAADLQAAVDGQLGTPLALVDFDRITDELGAFPLIRSYVTETLPPATLVIHVVERQPIGSIATRSGFSLVDPAGIVIERSAARIPGVPVIDVGEDGSDGDAFDAAVEVLVALPESVLTRLDTITATTRDDVRLTLVDTGASIIWGSADDSDYKGRALDALLANVPDASEFNVSAPGQGTYRP